jgi:hypothetical protein
MTETIYVRKTELARNTRRIIRSVQQGQTVVVESYGEPEAAIIDIIDYRLLLAAMHFYAHPGGVGQLPDLSAETITSASSPQEQYNLILGHYLAQAFSIGRAAELLELSDFDLRSRCLRLDIPLRMAPENVAEALADGDEALARAGSKPR